MRHTSTALALGLAVTLAACQHHNPGPTGNDIAACAAIANLRAGQHNELGVIRSAQHADNPALHASGIYLEDRADHNDQTHVNEAVDAITTTCRNLGLNVP